MSESTCMSPWVGGSAAGRFGRLVWFIVLIGVALLVAPAAYAAEPPSGLTGAVVDAARQWGHSSRYSASYVETSAASAARLLGVSRAGLSSLTPDRVYLITIDGDFVMDTDGVEERGSHLVFLYWQGADGVWSAADFSVLQDPLPLESVGVPQAVDSVALRHPELDATWLAARVALFWVGPAVVLVVVAILCAWRSTSRWPFVLAAVATLAVACWQILLVLMSIDRPWDAVFHGIKAGVLALVVTIDLAAAYTTLRARPQAESAAGIVPAALASRAGFVRSAVVLLCVAAALSVLTLPWLASTGE
ncbi:MAG: hypothetical protein R2826_02460 [Thermoleophilia bacterium]